MGIFGKKYSGGETKVESEKEGNEKNSGGKWDGRHVILVIITLVLLTIIAMCIITFNKQQNKKLNNNNIVNNSQTANIVARSAVISDIQGDVIINRNKIDVKAFNDFRLEEGDVIKTGSDSSAKINIDGNKLLKMDDNSIIQVATMSGNKEDNITTIILSNGRIMNSINEKLNANSRYEVKTLNTVIGVKGTVFVVTCESNADNNYFTKVENLKGSVEVKKVSIKNSSEVVDKVTLATNKYTVVEEKVNKQEKLKQNEIDTKKLDEFVKADLNKTLSGNKQTTKEGAANINNTTGATSTTGTEKTTSTTETKNNTVTRNTTSTTDTGKASKSSGVTRGNNSSLPKKVTERATIRDLVNPTLIISGPNVYSVKVGDQIKFVAQYFDNVGIREVVLTPGHIVLHGFKASINITGTDNSRIILLSNIQGSADANKYIEILAGTSIDTSGNVSGNAKSLNFRLEAQKSGRSTKNITRVVK